jgi:hypothetical protein
MRETHSSPLHRDPSERQLVVHDRESFEMLQAMDEVDPHEERLMKRVATSLVNLALPEPSQPFRKKDGSTVPYAEALRTPFKNMAMGLDLEHGLLKALHKNDPNRSGEAPLDEEYQLKVFERLATLQLHYMDDDELARLEVNLLCLWAAGPGEEIQLVDPARLNPFVVTPRAKMQPVRTGNKDPQMRSYMNLFVLKLIDFINIEMQARGKPPEQAEQSRKPVRSSPKGVVFVEEPAVTQQNEAHKIELRKLQRDAGAQQFVDAAQGNLSLKSKEDLIRKYAEFWSWHRLLDDPSEDSNKALAANEQLKKLWPQWADWAAKIQANPTQNVDDLVVDFLAVAASEHHPVSPELPRPVQAHDAQLQPKKARMGLVGSQIVKGDGKRREKVKPKSSSKPKFKALAKAGKYTGLVLGTVIASPFIASVKVISAIHNKIVVPRAEREFIAKNRKTLDLLESNPQNGVLTEKRVGAKLIAHKQANGQNATEEQIFNWVRTGERIAKALQADGGDKLPLTVFIDDTPDGVVREVIVASDTYYARCVSWYMMAQSAAQDVAREDAGDTSGTTSDMATDGSFVMQDPGNRMYNFLASASTRSARTSTHFGERLAHQFKHAFLGISATKGLKKPSQHGIEDFQSKLPGQGGAMLFDKIVPIEAAVANQLSDPAQQQLFVKFESSGSPALVPDGPSEGGHFFAALDRNVKHGLSFIDSRDSDRAVGGDGTVVQRQEHVYKGVLKPIAEEFSDLVAEAIAAGVISVDPQAAKDMDGSVRQYGLPYLHEAIDVIRQFALDGRNAAIAGKCDHLTEEIDSFVARLGGGFNALHGGDPGAAIAPRGAEVHIAL